MGTSARLRFARRDGSGSRHAPAALLAARKLLNLFEGCCTSGAGLGRPTRRVHVAVRSAGPNAGAADAICPVARIVNLSWHRVHAICLRYVELALASADLSDVSTV